MDIVLEEPIAAQSALCCPSCASANVRLTQARSAFWHDERLVVVEDIPALVCDDCGEQAFDDNAVVVIDLLRGEGFPAGQARGELRVPVFSFNDRSFLRAKS